MCRLLDLKLASKLSSCSVLQKGKGKDSCQEDMQKEKGKDSCQEDDTDSDQDIWSSEEQL